ncbi:uncharacterized protein EI97DRAFT_459734 [Westerdykella ornata]|uniref:Mitochondrial export protein Som1 n=1 Tax=Westerdykella ornata TaxID=318751 RepID=A0A6A6JFJ9_WESOR|nr:uncharacterized protein EI97DRAFT_459734 [Westerdykella ornata]KAF2275107.1 hypothetical protein EI97DRAFT_459734 [Westerdykella ornata]
MAPPIPTFPVPHLPLETSTLPNGKPRKPAIDLERDCAPKQLTQYKCNIDPKKKNKEGKKPLIVCLPVVRFYRACPDGLHVETTVWEAWKERIKTAEKA